MGLKIVEGGGQQKDTLAGTIQILHNHIREGGGLLYLDLRSLMGGRGIIKRFLITFQDHKKTDDVEMNV